jgi:hypothetical protein
LLIDPNGGRSRIVLKGWIRPQAGGDFVGSAGLDCLRLRPQRRVLLLRERERLRERQAPWSVLRRRQPGQRAKQRSREQDGMSGAATPDRRNLPIEQWRISIEMTAREAP